MCRLLGWVSDRPQSLREVLSPGSSASLAELSKPHADGWGAAYLADSGASLGTIRSPFPAGNDPAFTDFVGRIRTRAAIVHVRMATPGYGLGVVNNHPFQHGG
ncbi:MAG: class II glutamine amidotransferase [Mycobacteriales bacterium]|nr:MAG: hypothetical protein DLM59_07495 [Pseudonocardiales bacterium]